MVKILTSSLANDKFASFWVHHSLTFSLLLMVSADVEIRNKEPRARDTSSK